MADTTQAEEKQVYELTPEELDSLEQESEEGTTQEEKGEEKKEESTKSQSDSSEKEELSSDEGEKGEEAPEQPEEKEEKTGDPLKDTQRAFHQKAQEAAEWRKKYEELEKKLQELEGKKFEDFEELSDEEFEVLKAEDPEAAFAYLQEKTEYERWQQMQQQKQEMEEAQAIEQTQMQTWNNIVEFVKELGYDPEKDQQKFQEFLQSEEFKKIDQFVTQNFIPQNGVYTKEQIEAAYKALNFENLAAKERVNGRYEAVEDIAKASNTGSRFDRIPKTESGREKDKFANWTAADLQNASEAEIREYEKWLEEQGL